ncbi:MAG: lamin tail domain-containing protein [Spirochaetales bacterium]|nr:lamin tail domain-containing protein [Spirochaetales bacterium]
MRTLTLLVSILTILFLLSSLSCARLFDAEAVHAELKGHLFINELSANSTETDDWIELYNLTDSPIDLSGFYLGDDLSDPLQWTFPRGSIIRGNDYLVIMANNEDEGLQTNFSLGKDEAVVLSTPGGTTIIDSIDYNEIDVPVDTSYGRSQDAGEFWITFANPTMGSSNNL